MAAGRNMVEGEGTFKLSMFQQNSIMLYVLFRYDLKMLELFFFFFEKSLQSSTNFFHHRLPGMILILDMK